MANQTIPATKEHPSAISVTGARPRILALACMVVVAVLLHLATVLPRLHDRFDVQEHAWVGSHFMMMAHNFATDGVINLRAIPIQNNAPMGNEPDVYIHWPPLFPVTLSAAFRLLGENEATARILMLLIAAAETLALYVLGRSILSVRHALYVAFWWMILPVTATFGTFVIHLNLAILFLTLSMIAFLRATEGRELSRSWTAAGCTAIVFAVLSSWEPVLMCPGLFVAGWINRNPKVRRLAVLYALAATLAISAVIILYMAQNPANWGELRETVLFRLGLRNQLPPNQPLHSLPNQWEYQITQFTSLAQLLVLLRFYAVRSFGWIAILAGVIGLAALLRHWRHEGRVVVAVAGLLAAPCAWYLAMRDHVYQHCYEMLLFAPVIALLAAYACERLELLLEARHGAPLKIGIAPLIALVMIIPLAQTAREARLPSPKSPLVDYAEAVERATPPNAVVLTPERSMVPVYYSHRHLIRVVNSDQRVDFVLPKVRAIFPGAPVYLAIPFASQDFLPHTRASYKVVHRDNTLLLLQY